jgi:hypothetical protein
MIGIIGNSKLNREASLSSKPVQVYMVLILKYNAIRTQEIPQRGRYKACYRSRISNQKICKINFHEVCEFRLGI